MMITIATLLRADDSLPTPNLANFSNDSLITTVHFSFSSCLSYIPTINHGFAQCSSILVDTFELPIAVPFRDGILCFLQR